MGMKRGKKAIKAKANKMVGPGRPGRSPAAAARSAKRAEARGEVGLAVKTPPGPAFRAAQAEPLRQPLSDLEIRALRGRQTTDADYLLVLRRHNGWMNAAEISRSADVSRDVVGQAMRRLVAGGAVEEMVVEYEGSVRSVEHQKAYRARPVEGTARRVSDLPAWLAPIAVAAVGTRRLVLGAASMRRQDGEEEERSATPLRKDRPLAAA